MKCDDYESLAFISLHNAPYSSSLASAASASSTSVWSDTSSQNSDDTSVTAPTSTSDSGYSSQASEATCDGVKLSNQWLGRSQPAQCEIPSELRQNPRRTTRTGCPPLLVRQADRKVNFVDNLVDSSTHIVEAIWPTSSVICRNENGGTGVLPLRTFIQETLRRSRTSYSTLQVALYYLILIKPHVPARDFTMEQLDDCHASRAIQCGRRMFLAALILASKYLQDRNYSARAWSKISGLNTLEINQNEMAFLLAVGWKLHISDDVYNRWTECVMKFTPSQPPSPGGSAAQRIFERQCEDFRNIILHLTPELDNLEELTCWSPTRVHAREGSFSRSLFTPPNERFCAFAPENDLTPTKPCGTPTVMEPNPTSVHTPGRLAPALGLLPTPRLTPQSNGYSTPAVGAASYLLGKGSSMGYAMAQACNTSAVQNMDRWPVSLTSSPQSYATRRSSLVNSSTASSPESMVSDTSGASRSSSISSASSLASAPSSRLDVQARCRYAKLPCERTSLLPTIVSVPEDYEICLTSSPESYTGTVAKDLSSLSVETPLGRREREVDEAARALQDLHNHGRSRLAQTSAPVVAGLKRSRTTSIDNPLQDSVRNLLASRCPKAGSKWSENLVRSRASFAERARQIPVHAMVEGARKRVCCSAEAAEPHMLSPFHPSMNGIRPGPGMWRDILN